MDNISTLISRLKPDIIGIIQELGLLSITTDSSGNITTVLTTSQYPDAILRDGSRSLLNSLAVAAGATIDGVDLDVFRADFDSHLGADSHTIYASADGSGTRNAYQAERLTKQVIAGAGLTGGGVLDADRTVNVGAGTGISVAADSVAIDPTTNLDWTGLLRFLALIETHTVKPVLSDTYDSGASDRLWRKGWFSEFDAVVFAENVTSVVGGRLLLCKNQGNLDAEALAAATTMNFGKILTVGDFVVLRAAGQLEYVQVGSFVSGTTYNVTRNLDGSGANTWPAGSVYAVYGVSGDHRIEMNADDTPRISLLKQGATYNAAAEQFRLGDLNGNWGYSAATIGLAIGEYGSNLPNITIDPINGLRIRNYTADVLKFDPSGNAEIAGSLAFAAGVGLIGANGIEIDTAAVSASNFNSYRFLAGSGAGEKIGTYAYAKNLSLTNTRDDASQVRTFVGATNTTGDAYAEIAAHGSGGDSFVGMDEDSINYISTSHFFSGNVFLGDDRLTMGGTSFPASPADNDLYYRTDRDILYFYNSTLTKWLSVQQFTCPLFEQITPHLWDATTIGTSSQTLANYLVETANQNIYLEGYSVSHVVTTNNGSNYYTFTLQVVQNGGGGTPVVLHNALNTSADAANTNIKRTATAGTFVAVTNGAVLSLTAQRTGTPGRLIFRPYITYRKVG